MKIIISRCYGGFAVSKSIYDELGLEWDHLGEIDNDVLGITSDDYYAFRYDLRFVAAVEKVGVEEASGDLAELEVVEIPDDDEYEIYEYDGAESIISSSMG